MAETMTDASEQETEIENTETVPEGTAPDPASERHEPETTLNASDEASEVKTDGSSEAEAYRQAVADLQTELTSTQKALRDTQSWGRGMSQRLSELQKAVKESRLKGERPALLDDMEGLEQAIQHVLKRGEPEDDLPPIPDFEDKAPAADKVTGKSWEEQIAEAIPDLNSLLNDPELMQEAQAIKARIGKAWQSPAVAVAHLAAMRERYMQSRAQRDGKRLNGMSIPSSGTGSRPKPAPSSDDQVRQIWTESPEDFRKRKAQVLGLM